MTRLSFSVVINTYNRAELLGNTIASLLRQRHPQYEIVVINGPSSDNTAEVISQFRQHLKVADCPVANLGKSRNVGVAAAAGDIIAFIDDDATAEPNWLCELEPAYADPKVGAVGGFTRDRTGYGFQWKYMAIDWAGDAQPFDSRQQAGLDGHLTPNGFHYPSGVNSSFRRKAVLEVGGFDEFHTNVADDSDLTLRLIERGYTVRCMPSAQVHHRYAASQLRSHENLPKSFSAIARSRGYFAARHATSRLPLNDVMANCSRWLYRQHEYVSNLCASGKIGSEDASRLRRELDDGIRDGLREGLTNGKPRLRTCAELDRGGALKLITKRPADRTLRICFVSRQLPPAGFGEVGAWTLTTARGLAAAGHEVSIVTAADAHTTVDLEHGVWVHRIQRRRFPGRRGPDMPEVDTALRDHLLAVRDEVLRIHAVRGLHLVCAPLRDVEGMALIAGGELPVALSLQIPMHAVISDQPELHCDERANHLVPAEKWCLQHANFVVTSSQRLLGRIERLYEIGIERTRVSLVPRGLSDFAGSPGMLRRQSPNIVALFIGWQKLGKTGEEFLQVVSSLLERFPRLRFILACEECSVPGAQIAYADAFRRRHGGAPWLDRVDFNGFVGETEREELYRGCDIVVAPGRGDFFGQTYLEAMKFGRPVVADRAGVSVEIIEDGITGLLAAPGDPTQLALAVEELVASSARREAMGIAAREAFDHRFALDRMTTGHEALFFSLQQHAAGRNGMGCVQIMDRPVGLQSRTTDPSKVADNTNGVSARPITVLDPDRVVGPESRKSYALRVANGFFAKYLSGGAILEIGYKAGSDETLPIVPQAIGIDVDYPGYDGITLPFPDESQDAVYSSHCLEHIDCYQQSLQEWFRVLKVGGYMVIMVPHQYLYERRARLPSRWATGWHKRFYTPARLLMEIEETLQPNSYRIRHLIDNDWQYDYTSSPQEHPIGCYEIELVLQKIKKPSWDLDESDL